MVIVHYCIPIIGSALDGMPSNHVEAVVETSILIAEADRSWLNDTDAKASQKVLRSLKPIPEARSPEIHTELERPVSKSEAVSQMANREVLALPAERKTMDVGTLPPELLPTPRILGDGTLVSVPPQIEGAPGEEAFAWPNTTRPAQNIQSSPEVGQSLGLFSGIFTRLKTWWKTGEPAFWSAIPTSYLYCPSPSARILWKQHKAVTSHYSTFSTFRKERSPFKGHSAVNRCPM